VDNSVDSEQICAPQETSSQNTYRKRVLPSTVGWVLFAAALLLGPLILLGSLDATAPRHNEARTAEIMVGIAVVIRAATRRLVRGSLQNLLRSTFAAFVRTTGRTATRRALRYTSGSVAVVVNRTTQNSVPAVVAEERAGQSADPGGFRRLLDAAQAVCSAPGVRSVVSLILGCLVLALSFRGVLAVAEFGASPTLSQLVGQSPLLLSVAAALPILVYAAVTVTIGVIVGVKVRFSTAWDGVLLQAYFTGAGSFLPMTTDIEYDGKPGKSALLAGTALGAMTAISWAFHAGHLWSGTEFFRFCATVFLIYGFVYSFPISPLEGHNLWTYHKGAWLLVFIPLLLSFFVIFPGELEPLL